MLALVALNASLVAAEFALLAVRRTRAEHRGRAFPSPRRLQELLFAGQVARSTASILLGWYALAVARIYLVPLLGHGRPLPIVGSTDRAAVFIVIAIVVVFHATLGQQVPKLVAVHHAERIAAGVGQPVLQILAWVLWPVVRPLEWAMRLVLRPLGIGGGFSRLTEPDEELRMLVAAGADGGEIEEEEREMIRGVVEFSDTVAREVMTPRTAMASISVDCSFEQLLDVFAEEGHSRLPVYEGTIDSIVGVVLIKDLFPLLRSHAGDRPFDVRSIMRTPYFVPETKPVSDILSELRRQSVHLAIVLDEFGGTYGLVTMEDLLEEIVGEINDEFDLPNNPEFDSTPEGDTLIEGAVSLSEVNERFPLDLPVDDFDTLGGYVFGTLGRVPVEGDVVVVSGGDGEWELRVEEVEERRVKCVRLHLVVPVPNAVAAE